MTVAELKEKLRDIDPSLEVQVYDDNEGTMKPVIDTSISFTFFTLETR